MTLNDERAKKKQNQNPQAAVIEVLDDDLSEEKLEEEKKKKADFLQRFKQPTPAIINRPQAMPASNLHKKKPGKTQTPAFMEIQTRPNYKKMKEKRLSEKLFQDNQFCSNNGRLYCTPCNKVIGVDKDVATRHCLNSQTHIRNLNQWPYIHHIIISQIRTSGCVYDFSSVCLHHSLCHHNSTSTCNMAKKCKIVRLFGYLCIMNDLKWLDWFSIIST